MESLDFDDTILILLEKKDTCTKKEISSYVRKFAKNGGKVWIDDIDSAFAECMNNGNPDKYWWDSDVKLFRKQEILICPLCDVPHRKYPQVEKFSRLKALINGYGKGG